MDLFHILSADVPLLASLNAFLLVGNAYFAANNKQKNYKQASQ
ncbi:Uncharacterised protein [uncultured archaeon]|nr:Uncharacterised protein [uncultured archaeon]